MTRRSVRGFALIARKRAEGGVKRRDFIKLGAAAAVEAGAAKLLPAQMQLGMLDARECRAGRGGQGGFHSADCSGGAGACAQPHHQHDWIQRHVPRSGIAHEGRGAGDRRRDQRHGHARIRALARPLRSVRGGRGRRGGHSSGAAERAPPLPVHAQACRHALVSLACDGGSRSTQGHLYRAVWVPDDRFRQRSGSLRSGSFSWRCATGSPSIRTRRWIRTSRKTKGRSPKSPR